MVSLSMQRALTLQSATSSFAGAITSKRTRPQ
jgi:hypothetical protein